MKKLWMIFLLGSSGMCAGPHDFQGCPSVSVDEAPKASTGCSSDSLINLCADNQALLMFKAAGCRVDVENHVVYISSVRSLSNLCDVLNLIYCQAGQSIERCVGNYCYDIDLREPGDLSEHGPHEDGSNEDDPGNLALSKKFLNGLVQMLVRVGQHPDGTSETIPFGHKIIGLHLGECTMSDQRLLRTVVSFCPHLQDWSFSLEFYQQSENCVCESAQLEVFEIMLVALLGGNRLPELSRFNMTVEGVDGLFTPCFSDRFIAWFTQSHKKLKNISLGAKNGEPAVQAILDNCPELEEVRFEGDPVHIRVPVLEPLLKKTSVKRVVFNNFFCGNEQREREILFALGTQISSIHIVGPQEWQTLSSETIEFLIGHFGGALESLELHHNPITDNMLGLIGLCCPNLQKCVLNGCLSITDEGVRSFARHQAFHKKQADHKELQSFIMDNCFLLPESKVSYQLYRNVCTCLGLSPARVPRLRVTTPPQTPLPRRGPLVSDPPNSLDQFVAEHMARQQQLQPVQLQNSQG